MATRADVLRLKIDLDEREATRDMRKFTGEVERGNRKVASSNEKAAASFAQLGKSLALIGVAITGAIVAVDRLAKRMEKLSGVSTAFDTLGKRIDANARTYLPALGRATRHAVTDLELMRLSNNAIILGVAKSEEQFVKLAEGATRLGRAVGLDATSAVESLVTGIGRQSRLMLDNLGIIVKVEEANRKYAASIGKAASELSDEEKKTAFASEAIRAMDEALVGLNDETVRLSDVWNTAKSAIVNRLNEITEAFNNMPAAVRAFVGFMTRGGAPPPGTGALDYGTSRKQEQDFLNLRRMWKEANAEIVAEGNKILENLGKENKWAEDLLAFYTQQLEIKRKIRAEDEAALHLIPGTVGGRVLYDPLSAAGQSMIGGAAVGTAQFGPQFPADIQVAEDAVVELTGKVDQFGTIAAQSVAGFGGALVEAAAGADIAMGKMFANMLKNLAAAIVQAAILKSIMNSFTPGGGGGGGALSFIPGALPFFARGGVVGQDIAGPIMAQHGAMVRGGIPGRDSVPIIAQRGEAVLPPGLTGFLMEAARNSQRQPQSAAGTTRNASLAAPTNVYVTLNVGPGGYADGNTIRRFFEDHPEAVAAGIRMATRRGAM